LLGIELVAGTVRQDSNWGSLVVMGELASIPLHLFLIWVVRFSALKRLSLGLLMSVSPGLVPFAIGRD
jgi:hypothetical protein